MAIIPDISGGQAISQDLLQSVYDTAVNNALQPFYFRSTGQVVPTGTAAREKIVTLAPTATFTTIDAALRVDFNMPVDGYVMVYLPVTIFITTATAVAEVGMQLDGATMDLPSVFRFNSMANSNIGASANNHMFILSMLIPAGQHFLRPMVRFVSGTTPSMSVYFSDKRRTLVRSL